MRVAQYIVCAFFLSLYSCQEVVEHTAPAINDGDSVSMMTTYGVNTFITDSGKVKYRIVTERWDVNNKRNPSRWTFDKGVFLEQYDDKYKLQAYIQCDTAYYYDKKRLWELRGRVVYKTVDGMIYKSEQLYWDEGRKELYSNVFAHIITPEREIQGSTFKSDEKLRYYTVTNSKGSMVHNEGGDEQTSDNKDNKNKQDTTKVEPPKPRSHMKAKPKKPNITK